MSTGSGRDGKKGEAVEGLWAATLGGTLTSTLESSLKCRYEETAGGAPFSSIVSWLEALASRFPFAVTSAARTPLSVNGDVDALLRDGSPLKFEVKAQVKKPGFDDITQSDWIRDQTDLLSLLVQTDIPTARHFADYGGETLADIQVAGHWDECSLHLADQAGITDVRARRLMGVDQPSDLPSFIERKWFLHVTQEGARLANLCELAPIQYLLRGNMPNWELFANSKGRALRSLAPNGDTWFTYHLYPLDVPTKLMGRHKMHAAAFHGVTWV